MLKKFLMLPLMAFALVALTAATVSDDGEDIFEYEIISENTSLPTDREYDEQFLKVKDQDEQFQTTIYEDKENEHLDVYISSDSAMGAWLFYNYDNTYNSYDNDQNGVNLGVDYHSDIGDLIHIKITNYHGYEVSFAGGYVTYDLGDINDLNTYTLPLPTILEEFGGALSTVVTAGSSVFVSTFDGLWDVFWDADANDGDGALNWIAYVAVLPVGFVLVRWGIRKISGMIQQRM